MALIVPKPPCIISPIMPFTTGDKKLLSMSVYIQGHFDVINISNRPCEIDVHYSPYSAGGC